MKTSGMSVIHACIFTQRRIYLNSKYWLETYCPVYNLNFSMAYLFIFLLQRASLLMGFWPTFSLIWESELSWGLLPFCKTWPAAFMLSYEICMRVLGHVHVCAFFLMCLKSCSFLLFKVRHRATLHHVAVTLHHIVLIFKAATLLPTE